MTNKIKILIVEDHELFREGLKFILNKSDKFEVIADAANGEEFLLKLEKNKPDIVLMDIEMPKINGIEASVLAIAKLPKLKIIVLSSYGDEVYYSDMIKAGVLGFVLKKAGINELEKAIETVFNGGNFFSQDLLQKAVCMRANINNEPFNKLGIKLSKRENEVLMLISKGYSNIEISEKLFISPSTVNNHRSNLLSKTNTKNTASLLMFAIKNHILEINE
ncbi:MAG: response regulator [Bacteroidales bacterium]|nr:response regulator [Bacteroidales bacterium]